MNESERDQVIIKVTLTFYTWFPSSFISTQAISISPINRSNHHYRQCHWLSKEELGFFAIHTYYIGTNRGFPPYLSLSHRSLQGDWRTEQPLPLVRIGGHRHEDQPPSPLFHFPPFYSWSLTTEFPLSLSILLPLSLFLLHHQPHAREKKRNITRFYPTCSYSFLIRNSITQHEK